MIDPTGSIAMMRINQFYPPFDNPAIRRAVLEAVSQADYMTAHGRNRSRDVAHGGAVSSPGHAVGLHRGHERVLTAARLRQGEARPCGRRLQGREGGDAVAPATCRC